MSSVNMCIYLHTCDDCGKTHETRQPEATLTRPALPPLWARVAVTAGGYHDRIDFRDLCPICLTLHVGES